MKSATARFILSVLKKYSLTTTKQIMQKLEAEQDIETICIIADAQTPQPVCIGILTKDKDSEWLRIRCFDHKNWMAILCELSKKIENYSVNLSRDLISKKIPYGNDCRCDDLGNCDYAK